VWLTPARSCCLSTTITEACHDVDPGDGEIHECHEMSEEGDAATCEAEYDDCITLCEAAGE
jgi:hypothetical protein